MSAPTAVRRSTLIAAAFVALSAVLMAAWTWRRWADPIVDFGGEAYLAWRLAEGDVLYRDLANFIGPLASYTQALGMKLFGVSLTTVALVGLAQLALVLALLFRLCARLANEFAAAIACVGFTTLCGLALHSGAGNYNFVWPYSQDLPLAIALALLAFELAHHWLQRPRAPLAFGVGLCLGLVVLTKVETTVALAAGLLALWAAAPQPAREKLAHAKFALIGVAAPFALAVGLLSLAMPPLEALAGALGSWPHALRGDAADFPLYRIAMGLEPLGYHLTRIAAWSAGTAVCVALVVWTARRWGSLAAGVCGGALGAAAFIALPMKDALYPLSFYTLAALVFAIRTRAQSANGALRVGWCAFALLLLLRMALNARVEFYGFALAAPGVVVLLLALLDWIPSQRFESAGAVRAGLLPLVAALLAGHLWPMAQARRWNTLELGAGADRLIVSPRGQYLPEALAWVEERCPPGGSLLVLPEGALLNYLSRRRGPTRHFNFMPPELVMFGEQAMLDELMKSPPDVILLVHRDTTEYGAPFFGRDYGRSLMEWVKANYRASKLWSLAPNERPFEPGTRHAVAALERKR